MSQFLTFYLSEASQPSLMYPFSAEASPASSMTYTLTPNTIAEGIDDVDDDKSMTFEVKSEDNLQSSFKSYSQTEWNKMRPQITKLYSEERKTLPQVMDIMQNRGFWPSENMYKKRIKKWGLDKKFKKNEALAMLMILHRYKFEDTTPVFYLRGREVEISDLERYRQRARINDRELLEIQPQQLSRLAPGLQCRLRLVNLPSPEPTRKYEVLFHNLMSYLSGAFDAGVCTINPNGGNLLWKTDQKMPEKMWDEIRLGISTYRSGNFKNAGIAWRMGFLKVEALIDTFNPCAWLAWMDAQIQLRKCGALDVEVALKRHIVSMIDARLKPGSPHYSFVMCLRTLESDEMVQAFQQCTSIICDTWKQYLTPQALCSEKIKLQVWTASAAQIPVETDLYDERIAELKQDHSQVGDLEKLIILLKAKSSCYELARRWSEVKGVALEILNYIDKLPDTRTKDSCILLSLFEIGRVDYDNEFWKEAHAGFLDFLDEYDWYKKTYGEEYSVLRLYKAYEKLDYISNCTENGDRTQEWRQKLQMIERSWEDQLTTQLGELSLRTMSP